MNCPPKKKSALDYSNERLFTAATRLNAACKRLEEVDEMGREALEGLFFEFAHGRAIEEIETKAHAVERKICLARTQAEAAFIVSGKALKNALRDHLRLDGEA